MLQKRALWSLEHAEELPPQEAMPGRVRELRLWHYALDGPWRSWSLMLPLPRGAVRPLVREVVWRRAEDRRRLGSPVERLRRQPHLKPTLRIRDAEMSRAELAPFLDELDRLETRRGNGPAPLLEADAFGIQGSRSLAHLSLEWGGTGPPRWRTMIARINRLRARLLAALEEKP